MTDNNGGAWLGIHEAAAVLHLGERMTRRYGEMGRIRSQKIGHRRVYNRVDVEALAAELGAADRPQPPAVPEMMPAGEMLSLIERQAQQIAQLTGTVGRLQGIQEAQQHALQDAEAQRARVVELEAQKAMQAVEIETLRAEVARRRSWWRRLFGP